ncbi:MAG: hypothetical protein RBU45_11240 [Myxococcota bacterium]|jgi:hypothetical protein|nr:hypothetical protein [Myxococcota bacterium]
MSKPEPDDWLDTVLRRAGDTYLDDSGFTDRVLDRLPPRRHPALPRTLVILASTLLAGLVGLVLLPGGSALVGAAAELGALDLRALVMPLGALTLLATLTWSGVMAVRGS